MIKTDKGQIISIHAPTRGATVDYFRRVLPATNFNPRSHERSDGLQHIMMEMYMYFNPRSHERSDRNQTEQH